MADCCNTLRILTAAFEEATLALGGVAAMYPIPDEAVWELARTLDLIHERACNRCGAQEGIASADPDDDEHPAIIYLLAQLRSRGASKSDRGSK
jgi:hypothetical protein